jgi:hypothetical protein
MSAELVSIHSYKNKQLCNLYYNTSKNEFHVKKSENTNFCIPLNPSTYIKNTQIKRIMKINIKYIVMYISIVQKQKRKYVLLNQND